MGGYNIIQNHNYVFTRYYSMRANTASYYIIMCVEHACKNSIIPRVYIIMCVEYNFIMYHWWLQEEFIAFLDKWEASVAAREGCEKNKMLLIEEIRFGLRLTGMLYSVYS